MTALVLLALQLRLVEPTAAPAPAADRWFGVDKGKHFLLAGFVQSMGYASLRAAHVRHGDAQVAAFGVTMAFAVQKERRDRRAYGHFSVRDVVWSAAGALASAALLSRTAR